MGSNIAELNKELQRVASTLPPQQVKTLQKKIAIEALTRVVAKTPVDTGRARGNWQLTVGQAPETEKLQTDPTASALGELAALGDFDVVFISNNVPYIKVLEEGGFVPKDPGPSSDPRPGRTGRILVAGGFSVQAPQGMVSVTIGELLTIFK